MDKYHFYGRQGEESWHLKASWGVHRYSYSNPVNQFDQELWYKSDMVWLQGPKGGVRIIKKPWASAARYGYATTDEQAMKEFAWIKLCAKDLN